MDFGATMKGRTGGLESNGPEAGNRRKFLATAAAAGAAGAGMALNEHRRGARTKHALGAWVRAVQTSALSF